MCLYWKMTGSDRLTDSICRDLFIDALKNTRLSLNLDRILQSHGHKAVADTTHFGLEGYGWFWDSDGHVARRADGPRGRTHVVQRQERAAGALTTRNHLPERMTRTYFFWRSSSLVRTIWLTTCHRARSPSPRRDGMIGVSRQGEWPLLWAPRLARNAWEGAGRGRKAGLRCSLFQCDSDAYKLALWMLANFGLV